MEQNNQNFLFVLKASGEMVHYHNGKQVPAAFDGGAFVVHCHKNCLEWYAAPF